MDVWMFEFERKDWITLSKLALDSLFWLYIESISLIFLHLHGSIMVKEVHLDHQYLDEIHPKPNPVIPL